jgi:heme o synthase
MLKLFLDYLTLCKPNVVLLMLLTSWVGIALATNKTVPLDLLVFSTLGIATAAAGAAVINHLVDRNIDAKMTRTALRPIASGRITPTNALIFAGMLSGFGLLLLLVFVNLITAGLTFVTLVGYAAIYTLFLKRATPQNIVIGGIAGATPPLLGWSAVTGEVTAEALLLVLIIFAWTPPHFWALAIYRNEDYKKANIPMLPVTHGIKFTKLCIVLYTLLLFAITLLPFAIKMSGLIYLTCALLLGINFIYSSLKLYFTNNKKQAMKTFNFSIVYLLLLFLGLLVDHYYK